jgi:hypothetical protein
MIVAGAGGALATGGYGPPPPAPPTPGGYLTVVTSQTIGPAGGVIGPVSVDGIPTTVTVPPGAFKGPAQVTLTAPSLAAIGDAGFAGLKAVAGVGIMVQQNGSNYKGTFHKRLALGMQSSSITSSSIDVVWNGTAFVAKPSAKDKKGTTTLTFGTDPDFAVLTPTKTSTAAIPGATKASTGKPFLGEGILAALLLLLGVTGLGYARHRRARTSATTHFRA